MALQVGPDGGDTPLVKLFEFLVASMCLFLISDNDPLEPRKHEVAPPPSPPPFSRLPLTPVATVHLSLAVLCQFCTTQLSCALRFRQSPPLSHFVAPSALDPATMFTPATLLLPLPTSPVLLCPQVPQHVISLFTPSDFWPVVSGFCLGLQKTTRKTFCKISAFGNILLRRKLWSAVLATHRRAGIAAVCRQCIITAAQQGVRILQVYEASARPGTATKAWWTLPLPQAAPSQAHLSPIVERSLAVLIKLLHLHDSLAYKCMTLTVVTLWSVHFQQQSVFTNLCLPAFNCMCHIVVVTSGSLRFVLVGNLLSPNLCLPAYKCAHLTIANPSPAYNPHVLVPPPLVSQVGAYASHQG